MYIGTDLGTTACKTVMYDSEGNVLSEYNREYGLIIRDGFVEQDARLWWELVKEGILHTVRESGENVIDGISVSTQGIAVVPTDKTGEPLSDAISWLDLRSDSETDLLVSKFGEDAIYSATGKLALPTYTLPKLMWMKTHMRDIFDSADKFLLPLDFINMKLTGNAVTDYTAAGGTMAFDMKTREWNADLLGFAGVVGITGKLEVFLGGQDQKLAALGAGVGDGAMTVSLGTATAVTKLLDSLPDIPAREDRYSLFAFDRDNFSAEGVVSTSGSALKWVAQNLFGGASYKELDALCEEAGSSGGVSFSPDFTVGADIRGLTLGTTGGQIIYALYEGVSKEITALSRRMGGASSLIVFGGGAKSRIWCRILSDVSGLPVYASDTTETAALGAARLASSMKIPPAAAHAV